MSVTDASLLFAEANRADLGALAGEALLVLPIGATEQHGIHLPTGTDTWHAENIAREAATRVRAQIPIIVAPALAFGSSAHHLPFGATLSLESATLLAVLMDLGRSACRSGFRRLFFLNGHGGNHELVQVAARDLALQLPVHAGAGSWWVMAYDALVDAGAAEPARFPGHAGAFETAIVRALRPDLVGEMPPAHPNPERGDPRRPLPLTRTELHGAWEARDGYTDNPAAGTAEEGQRCLDAAATAVGSALVEFYRAAEAAGDPRPAEEQE